MSKRINECVPAYSPCPFWAIEREAGGTKFLRVAMEYRARDFLYILTIAFLIDADIIVVQMTWLRIGAGHIPFKAYVDEGAANVLFFVHGKLSQNFVSSPFDRRVSLNHSIAQNS